MELVPVTQMLRAAEKGGYGVGSFSARNTYLIEAILKAAQETKAPVIVQISANEFNWFDVTAREFADRFYAIHDKYQGRAALHLDHTKDMEIIKAAIDAGFRSVTYSTPPRKALKTISPSPGKWWNMRMQKR